MNKNRKVILLGLILFSVSFFMYNQKSQLIKKASVKQEYHKRVVEYQRKRLLLTKSEGICYFNNAEVVKIDKFPCKKGLRIIIQINGNCGKCINMISDWAIYLKEMKFPLENFIIYVHADNYAAFEYTMFENEMDSIYVIYDYDSLFFKKNRLDAESDSELVRGCVINDNNQIIAIGSPFSHPYIREQYFKLLIDYDK